MLETIFVSICILLIVWVFAAGLEILFLFYGD